MAQSGLAPSPFVVLMRGYRPVRKALQEAGLTKPLHRPAEEIVDSREVARHLRTHTPISVNTRQPVVTEEDTE